MKTDKPENQSYQSYVEKMELVKKLLVELRPGDRLEIIGEFCSDCGQWASESGHRCEL